MRDDSPGQLLIAEIFRHGDAEYVFVAPRGEVRRLPAIAARLERVRRADRKIERFLVVAVHVAKPHVEGAVGIDVETLVHGRDALTGRVTHGDELRRTLLGDQRRVRNECGDAEEDGGEAQGFGDHAAIIGPNRREMTEVDHTAIESTDG